MGGIAVKNKTSFKSTLAYFSKASKALSNTNLDVYGKRGVDALRSATPVDSGETSESWDYKIIKDSSFVKIIWTNSKVIGDEDIPLAILLQYGHANKSGVWVEGLDYINPALRPIFEEMANKIWKEASTP